MERLTENKIVLVVRETRLEELKARFNTVSQARFYVEQLGGNFADYEQEDTAYRQAVSEAQQQLGLLGRVQVVHRSFVPNFIFGPDDIAVAVGQDGLVANTLKYLNGQPLVGVNPDPHRYDGQLLPFLVKDLAKIIPEVFRRARPTKSVTMALAALNNGQTIHAVNDLFIGPKSHGSARYTINHGGDSERHSSSGIIVSTGLGSTGWFSSLVAGARGVTSALNAKFTFTTSDGQRTFLNGKEEGTPKGKKIRFPWDAGHLFFTVREPFPSKTTGVSLVFGRVSPDHPLRIESHMPERGVIFSDGIEADFLEFNSGAKVEISVAERKGILVV
ncbi:MAG: sugar kinase [Verrucomicrobia bacterium]|nr:sugar kinase [Verrucomicrobiota bacterium]